MPTEHTSSPDVPDAPAPELRAEDAERIAAEAFGVDGRARLLGSNQDRNALIEVTGGARLLLKVTHPETPRSLVEAQTRVVEAVAARLDGLALPLPLRRRDGAPVQEVVLGGVATAARLLRFVPGETLSGSRYLAPPVVAALGTLAARLDAALADSAPEPALDPGCRQWDLRRAGEVIDALLPRIDDPALATRLGASTAEARRAVAAVAARLPVQPIHGDLTDDNVVVREGSVPTLPTGVIDFGDLGAGWAVGELAVTVSSVLHHDGADATTAMAAVSAYHRLRPLSPDELAALWPLVVLRAGVLVVSAHEVLAAEPGNDYARDNLAHELLILERATAVPLSVGTALVRAAVGLGGAASSPEPAVVALPGLHEVQVVDLSVASPLLDEGRWLEPGVEEALLGAALADGADAAVLRFGERRLTRSVLHSADEPATVALHLAVALAREQDVLAPWPGEVESVTRSGLVLAAGSGRLHLAGVTPLVRAGDRVAPGGRIATAPAFLAASGPVTAALVPTPDDPVPPAFSTPAWAAAWEAIAADPAPLLLGRALPAERVEAGLLERRRAHLADVQEHYYAEPPTMVRGWRHHLVDADGRSSLDMVNNVTSIGHAHPRLVAAVERQWRLLNTNSRFHYAAIAEFSERLAATLPAPLDSVFLVNSGTEAVDLALRIARAATGRDDVLAVREAYHGWSGLSDAVSTSVADNPSALETRPPWVHTVDAPNAYRGRYRGAEASRYADDAVARIRALAAAGTPLGAVVAEAYYGNAGGMPLPEGYLAAVYAAVREHGGLAIADEVQVGYGRLGAWFWGFEQQGAVPDVVAVAKAMGNGHPLGAVVTTRAIAERYRTQGYFFSSAGGSPVSSVIGTTVLDVIRDEGLQENARTTGAHLKAALEELATRHPLIGAVHGDGLYLGVELVRDRGTLEPAREETAAICERLRTLGVILQPTSDRQCVLKIKPPLCITVESADAFVAALDRVLTTGW